MAKLGLEHRASSFGVCPVARIGGGASGGGGGPRKDDNGPGSADWHRNAIAYRGRPANTQAPPKQYS
jgi:hypothetical protein